MLPGGPCRTVAHILMKTKPFAHQQVGFDNSRDLQIYGIFWEQGLGKSKLLIDTVCHLYKRERIRGLLVIAPNGVHSNFLNQEVPVHIWDDIIWEGHTYYSGRAGTKRHQQDVESLLTNRLRLSILVMSYDALNTKQGFETAQKFLKQIPCLMALDESTAIGEVDAHRSKKTQLLGPLARYRRIMSGTPVAERPFKIFNQMRFLDKEYWNVHGLASYFIFKQTFAMFEQRRAAQGHQFQHLLGYRNLEYLQKLIRDHSSRVLKEDALDLPPKIYTTVEFDLESKQRKMYDSLRDQMIAQVDDDHAIEATQALIKMTRLQQLTSGYAVVDEAAPLCIGDLITWYEPGTSDARVAPITEIKLCADGNEESVFRVVEESLKIDRWFQFTGGDWVSLAPSNQKTIELFEGDTNPRLKALEAILDPITHKVIIWARFRKDIDLICRTLGDAAVRYDGIVKDKERELALHRFRSDDTIRYFVANQQSISMGVTLTQAKTVIYYSNNFALEKRLQSEDRAHRIGQDVSVSIIDLVARDTVDEHITATLRKKFDIAATVMGDRLREWLK